MTPPEVQSEAEAKAWLCTREVAAMLGRPEAVIRRQARLGHLRTQRFGTTRPLFRRADIEAILRGGETAA